MVYIPKGFWDDGCHLSNTNTLKTNDDDIFFIYFIYFFLYQQAAQPPQQVCTPSKAMLALGIILLICGILMLVLHCAAAGLDIWWFNISGLMCGTFVGTLFPLMTSWWFNKNMLSHYCRKLCPRNILVSNTPWCMICVGCNTIGPAFRCIFIVFYVHTT